MINRFFIICSLILCTALVSAQRAKKLTVKPNKRGAVVARIPLVGKTSSMLSLKINGIAGGKIRRLKAFVKLGKAKNKLALYKLNKLTRVQNSRGCVSIATADGDRDSRETLLEWINNNLSEAEIAEVRELLSIVRTALDTVPASSGDICSRLRIFQNDLPEQVTNFINRYYSSWTVEDTCEALNSDELRELLYEVFLIPEIAPVLPRALNKIRNYSYQGLFTRNECLGTNERYVLILRFRVPKETSRVQLEVKERFHEVSVKKGATLKPVSDGRFAPDPLLLMETLSFCGQRLSSSIWSDTKVSSEDLPIADVITHRGRYFNRVDMGSHMSSRATSYYLEGTSFSYGVCFDAERRRQYNEDYPR